MVSCTWGLLAILKRITRSGHVLWAGGYSLG
nr:MAG TPA: hypothetical protein [Caudoviricetes sp.]